MNRESLGRQVQQDLFQIAPSVCSIAAEQQQVHWLLYFLLLAKVVMNSSLTCCTRLPQLPPIVLTAEQPLVAPSTSPSPSPHARKSDSSPFAGMSLVYIVAAGAGGILLTSIAGLLLWRYRRNKKKMIRKVCRTANAAFVCVLICRYQYSGYRFLIMKCSDVFAAFNASWLQRRRCYHCHAAERVC